MLEPISEVQVTLWGGNTWRYPMPMKYVAAALLASSLLSAPALAQSAQQPAASNATAAQKVKMQQLGTWRTSKLIGLNVYNSNNEKIGDINELINLSLIHISEPTRLGMI